LELGRDAKGLEVPEGRELEVSPGNPELSGRFLSVAVGTVEDLKILGLVPKGLEREALQDAVEKDDQLAADAVLGRGGDAMAPCTCHGGGRAESPGKEGFRAAVQRVRRSYQPNLARVLSRHYGRSVAWDSPVVGITRRWLDGISKKVEWWIEVLLADDIVINANATLVLQATTRSLMAGRIRIHRTGRLSSRGGYLKIWANEISAFGYVTAGSVSGTAVAAVTAAGTAAPWLGTR